MLLKITPVKVDFAVQKKIHIVVTMEAEIYNAKERCPSSNA